MTTTGFPIKARNSASFMGLRMSKTICHGLALMVQAATQREDVPRIGVALVTVPRVEGVDHRARIISPLPLHVAKTGRNHLNEEFTPLLPTGIGERF
jgi:hypothetical protein